MKTIKRNQEWPMKGKELHDDRIFNLNKRKTATSHSCRPHQWHPLSTRQSARPKNITGSCKPHYTDWHSPAVPRSEKRRPTVWTGIRQRTVSSCKISRLANCSLYSLGQSFPQCGNFSTGWTNPATKPLVLRGSKCHWTANFPLRYDTGRCCCKAGQGTKHYCK